ncbi:MAG: PEP-CTERM sorting domain-containing protein [Acidobacteriia bacterium]|nr:PEP-CTERM sorting domain-containing protein [Terriglobia bacterium]
MKMKRIVFSLLVLGAFASLSAAPLSYLVTVDSSSIAPGTPGFIEFQFNQANAGTSLAAMAYVDNFVSTGFTFDNGSNAFLGGVTGSLSSPPLIFDNTGGGSNYFDQGVSEFGSAFSFVVTFDGAALDTVANDGSEFFVYLYSTQFEFLAGPGRGGAVASIALNGDTTVSTGPVEGFSTISAVPEPATFVLFGFAGVLMVARRIRR